MTRIRPYSAAWWRNQNKQGDNITVSTPTGFPDMASAAGVPDWVQATEYVKDSVVYRDNSLFRANSDIPANTAFEEGAGVNEWTSLNESPGLIPQFDPEKDYAKDTPVSVGEVLYRAKIDLSAGPFIESQWDRLSAIPSRTLLTKSDPDLILLNGFKSQEIIFEDDRIIGNFDFKGGDRVILRNDLSGKITDTDFHYYPFLSKNAPADPPEITDLVRTATIGDDIGFFYVFNPDEEIILDVDISRKITWSDGATPSVDSSLAKITWFRKNTGLSSELIPGIGFTVNPDNNKIFKITGDEGLEENDEITLTYIV